LERLFFIFFVFYCFFFHFFFLFCHINLPLPKQNLLLLHPSVAIRL
jgi:hypothetical protein